MSTPESRVSRPIRTRSGALLFASALLFGCAGESASEPERCDDSAKLPATDPSPDCDPLLPDVCALPWPSSRFLVPDDSRKTGFRLALGATTLPANGEGKHVSLAGAERMDGFGVAGAIVARFPGLDPAQLASETDIGKTMEKDSPTLLFEVAGDKLVRVPHFAELDQTALKDADRSLLLRPAVILKEATRYVVALRGLVDKDGKAFEPSAAFAALRDCATKGSYLQARQARFDGIFDLLEKEGIARADLLLAWDFTTASSEAMHGRMLAVRKKAFEVAGAKGPELVITKIEEKVAADDGSGKPVDPNIALSIEGTFKVPSFVKEHKVGEETGYILNLGEDGVPAQNGTTEPKFWIQVPHSAIGAKAAGLLQYGHGLLGKGSQVRSGWLSPVLQQYGYIGFACNWTGMADPQEKVITSMIFDFSDFRIIPEHLHQGYAESMLLARAMRERFATLPEIVKHKVAVDPKRLFYYGNSQGGIYGATLMALSPDIPRGQLGVPGQNYSTLLNRSVDFMPFFAVMMAAYGSATDRCILLSAAQVLWDMADSSSYYRHIKAEPFVDTPAHDVLLTSAVGDWQVALVTNEISARSGLGVEVMKNYGKALWGVTEKDYPHKGSGLVNYHFGNPWPKAGNRPPQDDVGDPHEWPRRTAAHNEQMIHFLETGEIKDVCSGKICEFPPVK